MTKKIINGKLYNTETAKEIGSHEHGFIGDFDWYEETLYRKKNGEYFVHGEGHAASPYRKAAGIGGWASGEAIAPMSFDDAREWAEKNLTADEYEAEFGLPDEDGAVQQLTCMISARAYTIIRQAAHREGKSISDVVEGLALTLETV